jgi:hypothetical protein
MHTSRASPKSNVIAGIQKWPSVKIALVSPRIISSLSIGVTRSFQIRTSECKKEPQTLWSPEYSVSGMDEGAGASEVARSGGAAVRLCNLVAQSQSLPKKEFGGENASIAGAGS